jgi:hypothetical protein
MEDQFAATGTGVYRLLETLKCNSIFFQPGYTLMRSYMFIQKQVHYHRGLPGTQNSSLLITISYPGMSATSITVSASQNNSVVSIKFIFDRLVHKVYVRGR